MPAKPQDDTRIVTVTLTQAEWVTIMAYLTGWQLSDRGEDVFKRAKHGLFDQACRDPRKGRIA